MDHKASKPVRPLLILTIAIALLQFTAVSIAHETIDNSQQGRDEVRIELSASGFMPAEVQHGPGVFALAIENKTVSGEYTLILKAEDGTVLHEFQIQKGSSAWSVNLPTGRYTLTEANHPQWVCRIVVQ